MRVFPICRPTGRERRAGPGESTYKVAPADKISKCAATTVFIARNTSLDAAVLRMKKRYLVPWLKDLRKHCLIGAPDILCSLIGAPLEGHNPTGSRPRHTMEDDLTQVKHRVTPAGMQQGVPNWNRKNIILIHRALPLIVPSLVPRRVPERGARGNFFPWGYPSTSIAPPPPPSALGQRVAGAKP